MPDEHSKESRRPTPLAVGELRPGMVVYAEPETYPDEGPLTADDLETAQVVVGAADRLYLVYLRGAWAHQDQVHTTRVGPDTAVFRTQAEACLIGAARAREYARECLRTAAELERFAATLPGGAGG